MPDLSAPSEAAPSEAAPTAVAPTAAASTPDPLPAERIVFLLAHTGREAALQSVECLVEGLLKEGIKLRVLAAEAPDMGFPEGVEAVPTGPAAGEGCELILVLGGDGTLLRGAELAREFGVPMLGVNLGRVGFLAEAERDDLQKVVQRVAARDYEVEQRMTIDVVVREDGRVIHTDWALNEASVEKASRERMIEVVTGVDGRPVSSFGCDGVVCATPTGSTAYAFSAGGPVVWPEVEALLMVPISAHALFARPLVTSPDSVLEVQVQQRTPHGVLWCDGRRTFELPPGARVEVRKGHNPVLLARLHRAPFSKRLVHKFQLPVTGWRGAADED